ncbi:TPA: hypothetical protein ACMY33_001441 [Yersinia enterocolitica]|nr:hypothetical protein [Yersinia enterocolitica]HEB1852772.1 hypothetical protein [Yersinia enterocolitica]
MNNLEEKTQQLKANVELSKMATLDELTVSVSDLDALIAQLEAAQKEITDWRSVAEAAAQDDADWHKLVDSKNDVISRLASGIINLKAQMEASRAVVALYDEKLAKAEAELSAANEKLQVPAGYCIMPESLTAENGAKGALSGEFFTETDITCEECGGDCDEDDPCEHCNDLGVQTVRAAIGWSTIKDIYKMAVGTTAIRPVGLSVEGDADAE